MNNNNKPVPVNSPAGMVQSLIGLIPAGASVTVSVPVGQKNLNVSVGISQGVQVSREPNHQQVIEMAQDVSYPHWYQQPAAE